MNKKIVLIVIYLTIFLLGCSNSTKVESTPEVASYVLEEVDITELPEDIATLCNEYCSVGYYSDDEVDAYFWSDGIEKLSDESFAGYVHARINDDFFTLNNYEKDIVVKGALSPQIYIADINKDGIKDLTFSCCAESSSGSLISSFLGNEKGGFDYYDSLCWDPVKHKFANGTDLSFSITLEDNYYYRIRHEGYNIDRRFKISDSVLKYVFLPMGAYEGEKLTEEGKRWFEERTIDLWEQGNLKILQEQYSTKIFVNYGISTGYSTFEFEQPITIIWTCGDHGFEMDSVEFNE